MKRVLQTVMITSLVAASAGIPASRAEGEGKPTVAAEHDRGPRRAGLGPRLGRRLGLSEEQAVKLEAAFKARREASKPLRRELRDSMLKLRDLVQDEAGEKEIGASLERVSRARAALEAQTEKFHKELTGLLSARQRALLLLGKARRGAMGRRGRGAQRGRGPRERGQGGGPWED